MALPQDRWSYCLRLFILTTCSFRLNRFVFMLLIWAFVAFTSEHTPYSNSFSQARLASPIVKASTLREREGKGVFLGAEEMVRRRAHSHNDYWQEFPFSSAILHGMMSVEVDVFPRGEKLLVGHTRLELQHSQTIENMYIRPILDLIEESNTSAPSISTENSIGWFNRRGSQIRKQFRPAAWDGLFLRRQRLVSVRGELNLLVDFKGNPEASVALLRDALSPLRPYLTHVDERGRLKRGIVTVLISGRRPSDKSLFGGPLCKPDFNSDNDHAQQCRYLFIDGRVKDVTGNADSLLVPLVSIHWRTIQFARLFGRGEKYMKKLSDRAHAQGKQLRIWGAPNSERIWKKMVKSNVDYLSIDDHDRFAIFAKRFRFV